MEHIETFINIKGSKEKDLVKSCFKQDVIEKLVGQNKLEILMGKDIPSQWKGEADIVMYSENVSPITTIHKVILDLPSEILLKVFIVSFGEYISEGYRYFKSSDIYKGKQEKTGDVILCKAEIDDEDEINDKSTEWNYYSKC